MIITVKISRRKKMTTSAAQQVDELKIGDKAPNFKLPTDGSGNTNLADYKGKNNVVLYFYPKDDTPGCTVEAHDFRDNKASFEKLDTVIIGLSKDSVNSHDKFKDKHELNFQLASDESGETVEGYGCWVKK